MVTEVQSFHGLALFYWMFIPQFSMVMAPIVDCMKSGSCMKSTSFSWTKEAKEAFEEIKRSLINAPILVLLDFNIPFKLHVDASNIGI